MLSVGKNKSPQWAELQGFSPFGVVIGSEGVTNVLAVWSYKGAVENESVKWMLLREMMLVLQHG